MQDVCISFWPEGDTPGTSAFPDMIAKVTDICSTDPNDPTHCATPSDIKLDRAKVQVMYNIPSPGKENHDLQQPVYPKGIYWHLTKCVRIFLKKKKAKPPPQTYEPLKPTFKEKKKNKKLTTFDPKKSLVDQRPPPTRLPRQLVRPTPPPQQLQLGRRRHPPAVEKQPGHLPGQRVGYLPQRHGDPHPGSHCRHRASGRLGRGARTLVGADSRGQGVRDAGAEPRTAAGALAGEIQRAGEWRGGRKDSRWWWWWWGEYHGGELYYGWFCCRWWWCVEGDGPEMQKTQERGSGYESMRSSFSLVLMLCGFLYAVAVLELGYDMMYGDESTIGIDPSTLVTATLRVLASIAKSV